MLHLPMLNLHEHSSQIIKNIDTAILFMVGYKYKNYR
jgi:hypothetical protein